MNSNWFFIDIATDLEKWESKICLEKYEKWSRPAGLWLWKPLYRNICEKVFLLPPGHTALSINT